MRRLLVLLPLCLLCLGAGNDVRDYPRVDPNNPGGERLGVDDRGDDWEGYPADPGTPDDAYHDTSSEYRAYSPNYTGAFIGGGLVAGYTALWGGRLDHAAHGFSYGAFFNWSSLMQVLDLQLLYMRADFNTQVEGQGIRHGRQTLGANVLIHPIFLRIIAGRRGLQEANAYLLVGAGLEFHNLVPERDPAFKFLSMGWRVGLGIDRQISDFNNRGGFWLGIQYQHAFISGVRSDPRIGRAKLNEDTILLRLSYRHNGNWLSGFPGPPQRSADGVIR